MQNIDIIAGARPNFMKIAPLVEAIRARQAAGSRLRYRLVHTGQHYDATMSERFFSQLDIPPPDVNLEVGSGTQAEQTAAIMVGYEQLLATGCKPDLCLVVGDVNSTMACAITASKQNIPVAHVEAGIRSGDRSMPEEINRIVTDSLADWFFTTSEQANANLRQAGIPEERICFVGNTMIDTLLKQRPNLRPPDLWATAGLQPKRYLVLTLHRPANVDDPGRLEALLVAILDGSRDVPVVWSVHPRVHPSRTACPSTADTRLLQCEPLGYLEFNYLVSHALGVVTDSGGITEETTVLGVPCMTLRDSTERPETVELGTNELVGTDPKRLQPHLDRLFAGHWKTGSIPPLWDGRAAERIIARLEAL